MSNIAIQFKNVSKIYPNYHFYTGGLKHFIMNCYSYIKKAKSFQFHALKDLSFTIQKGECVAFIGRNGAGKSTTLGMIAGVLRPNKGSITVNGLVAPLLELGGGFHVELSGRENLMLNSVLLGLSRKQAQERFQSMVDFSELGHFIDQPIRTYSSGMLARLAFSVVAHLDPDILLVDEILAVGDAGFQKKCFDRIKQFKEQGMTIILVTHSASEVEKICDRVIWVDNHTIKMDGPINTVLPEYEKFYQPI